MTAESQFSAALDDWAAAMADALTEIETLRAKLDAAEATMLWLSTERNRLLLDLQEARRETVEACARMLQDADMPDSVRTELRAAFAGLAR